MSRTEYVRKLIDNNWDSRAKFAKHIGIPPTTLQSILERGIGKASIDNVLKICKGLGIKADSLEQISENNIDAVAEPKTKSNIVQLPSKTYRYLPDVKVSAGVPLVLEATTEYEAITIPDNLLGKYAGNKDIFFMRVNGESMNKVIPHDSLIAVKQATLEEIKDGDIVVFSNGYDYSVKFFYQTDDKFIFKPSSTEPIFTDYILDKNSEELRLHGRVITYVINLD